MTIIESNRYPPVGEFVDLGSYQAHYYKKGEGKITYVFITGSGTPCIYTGFFHLQNELAAKMLNRGTAFLRTLGINRLLGEIGVLLPLYGENIRNSKLLEGIAKESTQY